MIRTFTHYRRIVNRQKNWLGISLCSMSLCGCVLDGTSSSSWNGTWDNANNEGYFMQAMPDEYNNPPVYSESYDTSYHSNFYGDNGDDQQSKVIVPQSYHVGGISNTPMTAKEEDKHWVQEKNPSDYTIQVQKNRKPSQVANTLQRMPKNERSVEVRSHSGSYIGLHGNYRSREAAEAQLNNLPENVKDQATIKNWGTVQKEVE